MQRKGETLASLLNNLIDDQESDNDSRVDIMSRMGRAGGISTSTVGQILRAEINCPPLSRLRGFAEVLGTTLSRLRTAAENDGCEYVDGSDNAKHCILTPGIKLVNQISASLKKLS